MFALFPPRTRVQSHIHAVARARFKRCAQRAMQTPHTHTTHHTTLTAARSEACRRHRSGRVQFSIEPFKLASDFMCATHTHTQHPACSAPCAATSSRTYYTKLKRTHNSTALTYVATLSHLTRVHSTAYSTAHTHRHTADVRALCAWLQSGRPNKKVIMLSVEYMRGEERTARVVVGSRAHARAPCDQRHRLRDACALFR